MKSYLLIIGQADVGKSSHQIISGANAGRKQWNPSAAQGAKQVEAREMRMFRLVSLALFLGMRPTSVSFPFFQHVHHILQVEA